ncbi:hypothetical protein [Nocardia asteroides]|uniref:hypothetical protein n=1 Tax=Nocardia asteroides TaxID=1824 RepID=UPI001E323A46|nr:hypothetical protein [Nocardia asteroides]UGT60000.1 hypothetical protein LTT61_22625 [Nocardia asteroides]
MTDDRPAEPGFPAEFSASTVTGSIAVRTTETGLPLGITLDPDQLRRDPGELAAEILRLCRQSAARAGLARREHLRAAGFTPEMLARTGLPTEREVVAAEIVAEQEYETEPQSWLRSV